MFSMVGIKGNMAEASPERRGQGAATELVACPLCQQWPVCSRSVRNYINYIHLNAIQRRAVLYASMS